MSMTTNVVDEFAQYLTERHINAAALLAKLNSGGRRADDKTLRDLYEASDLSANDFAEEVAAFYRLPRIALPQLIAAQPLTAKFSRRFLRETLVFPYQGAAGSCRLVLTDPTDEAPVRAAEIVLGHSVEIEIGSYEDIATVLTKRLGEDDEASSDGEDVTSTRADDDVESLRDLASGAPVVRAVNDLLERAMELRATDIHIEPFRTGLVVRMRVDGLLRAVPTPSGVLPAALISRIKILAGLNIAERRLPQDGAARVRVARTEFDVRDAQTANIAIHAALTGHLVLTTLHTETAAAAVPRLLDLGVEGFLLKSTLRAVIAQRLVRILCDRCRVQKRLTAPDLAVDPRYGMLGFKAGDSVCEPAGCERCGGTGYRGRSGVFECLEMTEPVRKLIGASTDSGIVEEAAIQAGMTTMIEDAVAKCRAGVTSAAEVLRVTTVR